MSSLAEIEPGPFFRPLFPHVFPDWNEGVSKLVKFLAESQLRLDGVYVSKDHTPEGKKITRCFRFYQSGKVVGDFFVGDSKIIFAPKDVNLVQQPIFGDYEVSGSKIFFDTKNRAGDVSYEGDIGRVRPRRDVVSRSML